MSEESSTPDLDELARRTFDAMARRDYDAMTAVWASDGVWDTTPTGGMPGAVEGRDAIRAALEDWMGPSEDWEQEVEEFRDLGNGVVFNVLLQRGRLSDRKGVVALRFANLSTWASWLVERTTTYTDIDEGRAAAERLAQERS
jgi:ketosteroid isomerase-like protein